MTTGTSETKAYRVWLTNENKLKISRDVIILDDDVDNNNIKIINEEHLLSENEFINNEDNEHEENMIRNYDNNTSINDGFKGFSPASISKSNQNEGIGAMRIMKRGVELRGQAAVLDNLIASTISSRNGRNLMLESWSNFTATTRAANGHISARLTLNEKQVDLITKSFEIASLDGETLFSADREQVVVGATLLKVTGVGGATFHGSLETSLVRSESGLGLRLESSTRALEVRASERVVVESRAGEILTNSLLDLTLQSVEGAVKLDAKIIILKGLTIQIKFTHDDQRQHYQSIPKNRSITNEEKLSVYQLCACANGKLFLARPDGICQADNTICY
ncbi:hypothetical protein HCN44_004819 [Aphidius gifuensis]|uniref:Uncharacterized protein n=1 Tax=Aphidius gifuensis TaxID=684658 RepID=A0A834XS66_APHGI|nr:hypothetical protein HCN44_004819 [Aphidius gifuensis]